MLPNLLRVLEIYLHYFWWNKAGYSISYDLKWKKKQGQINLAKNTEVGFCVIKINSSTLPFQLAMVMEAAARVFVGCSR